MLTFLLEDEQVENKIANANSIWVMVPPSNFFYPDFSFLSF